MVTLPRGCAGIACSRFLQNIALKPALLFAIVGQLVTELGMGNLDQGLGALTNRLAVQIRDAVLGHNVVDVATSRENAGAVCKPRHDARYGFVLGCRRQRDDRLPSLGACGSADEIELTAEAAIEAWSDRFSTNLSGKVNLDCRVDG